MTGILTIDAKNGSFNHHLLGCAMLVHGVYCTCISAFLTSCVSLPVTQG
ncbi:MAG: hypothetical protein WC736_14405 [Gallionella sp.]|jgi:hypothetical protein